MTALLEAENLRLIRGDRCLFRDLSFAVEPGELLVIEGANGSGKTSLLRALAGLLSPEEGRIAWRGAETQGDGQRYRAELVWMAHKVGFKGDLTPLENLRFEAGLRSCSMQRLDAVLERLELAAVRELPFRALSAGQQRRVALARMLLAEAVLWLMDEPFTNLDAAGQRLVLDLVSGHLASGGACIMASHQVVSLDVEIRRIRLQ